MGLSEDNEKLLARVGIFPHDDWKMSIIHLTQTVIELIDEVKELENDLKKEITGEEENTGEKESGN